LRKNTGYVRLRADVEAYREEFDALVARTDGEATFWKQDVEDLLEKVDRALEQGHVEDGWRYLHAAHRIDVHGLEALDESDPTTHAVETRARVVREEALDALGGWRKRAVEDLLGREGLDTDVSGEAVREASRILHDQYESVHLKRQYLQRQFNQLFWLGTIAGVVFIVLSLLPYFSGGSFLQPPFQIPVVTDEGTVMADPNVSSAGFAVFVGLAGVVGASLFGMRSLRNQTLSTKVAQRITGLTLTWARGLIGAISALVFYFLLQTPFTSFDENTAAVMIVVGFAAGYSERMVSRAVETVSGAAASESNA
jgi:lipid-A-disaccharide synthase-like uncharacterized protein